MGTVFVNHLTCQHAVYMIYAWKDAQMTFAGWHQVNSCIREAVVSTAPCFHLLVLNFRTLCHGEGMAGGIHQAALC